MISKFPFSASLYIISKISSLKNKSSGFKVIIYFPLASNTAILLEYKIPLLFLLFDLISLVMNFSFLQICLELNLAYPQIYL